MERIAILKKLIEVWYTRNLISPSLRLYQEQVEMTIYVQTSGLFSVDQLFIADA